MFVQTIRLAHRENRSIASMHREDELFGSQQGAVKQKWSDLVADLGVAGEEVRLVPRVDLGVGAP